MDFSFVFVLGLDNNITPNIPSGSNNPGGIPGPSGNHNNSLGLANNDDPGSRNRRNRRTLANINHTSPHKLIFDSTSRREKYEKTVKNMTPDERMIEEAVNVVQAREQSNLARDYRQFVEKQKVAEEQRKETGSATVSERIRSFWPREEK